MPGAPSAEARLRDPAHRDQDGAVWRRGRFAERVRRQWNAVTLDEVPVDGGDLDAMAQAVQARVGGDVGHIRERLDEFAAFDRAGLPPSPDPLVRPGAPE
jgi:hypothetical protein